MKMKIVNIGGGGLIGARPGNRLRGNSDDSVPLPTASEANTLGLGGIGRLDTDADDLSVSTSRSPQIDWQEDPR
jgi:hypothetical protein